jgi:hypothetical protein
VGNRNLMGENVIGEKIGGGDILLFLFNLLIDL